MQRGNVRPRRERRGLSRRDELGTEQPEGQPGSPRCLGSSSQQSPNPVRHRQAVWNPAARPVGPAAEVELGSKA